MISLIADNREKIGEICKRHRAVELYAFGSVVSGGYVHGASDIDLVVVFDPDIPVIDMADHYFGLIEELEGLLGGHVDLVSFRAVKNRIFKEELERTMVPLYAA